MVNFSMKDIFFPTLFLALALPTQAQKKLPKLLVGDWTATLQLTEKDPLPFKLLVDGSSKKYNLKVINGGDTIELDRGQVTKDSIHFKFPDFNSELVFARSKKNQITGLWKNYNKGTNYKIPFSAQHGYTSRIPWCGTLDTLNSPLVDGKWEVYFDYDKASKYASIGNFVQSGDMVEGSFLTETGDFGFLEGNLSNDSLYLTGFDGSKAYLLKSKIQGDSMVGTFRSGIHFLGNWKAVRNNEFELTHPDSLTILVSDFHFTATDLNKNEFSFPNSKYNDKVVIVQIMGSWCANCIDETRLFKELYGKYNASGLEIISVSYEIGADLNEWISKVNRLKEKREINYELLVGGSTKAGEVMKDFPALQNFVSYPTSIFIDRQGNVRKIHTGFTGPGTGEYYTKFVEEITVFLQELLAE